MERRLAAILAADVVGYTRLMGMDEAGTLSALTKHRRDLFDPKAAQYGGRTGGMVLTSACSHKRTFEHFCASVRVVR